MMTPNIRSVSGALMMLAIIPIFAGLLACMPEHVPLGNPERARIDPDLSGLWVTEEGGSVGSITMLQPWDKRSWLVISASFSIESDDEVTTDVETYDELIQAIKADAVEFGETTFYKVWLAKIGGQTFSTWEIRGLPTEEGLEPFSWMDFRVDKKSANVFELSLLDEDHPAFADIPRTRRDWERAIRKNLDDEELFGGGMTRFRRVLVEDYEAVAEQILTIYFEE